MSFSGDVSAKATAIRNKAADKRAEEINDLREIYNDDLEGAAKEKYGLDMIKHGDAEWKKLHDGYSWIEPLFTPLGNTPEPSASKGLATSMGTLVGEAALSKSDKNDSQPQITDLPGKGFGDASLSQAGTIQDLVAHWHGGAATEFHDNFLGNFDPCKKNQIVIGKILRDVAQANSEMLQVVRDDTVNIQKQALSALDAVGDGGSNSDDVVAGLGIAAAVACLAGGFFTLPIFASATAAASAAGSFTMLSGLASGGGVAAGLKKDGTTDSTLSADTVDGVLDKMFDAVNKVMLGQSDCEKGLVDCLGKNTTLLMENAESPVFVTKRPKLLADAKPGHVHDNFEPPV